MRASVAVQNLDRNHPLNTTPVSVYIPRMLRTTTRTAALLGLTAIASACASTSRYEGMDAEQIYRLAQQEFEDGDYKDAAESFDRLLLSFPDFEQIAEAAYMYAESEFLSERYISSASEYTRFIDRYPAHPRVPEAALGICLSNEALSPIPQRDQQFTEQALLICSNVAADYRGTEFGEEAGRIATEMRDKLAQKVFDNGHYYLRRGLDFSAVIYFEEVLEDYPATEFAPKALVGIMDAYTSIGYADEVEAARQRLVSEYPDSPEAALHGAPSQNGGGGDSTAGGIPL